MTTGRPQPRVHFNKPAKLTAIAEMLTWVRRLARQTIGPIYRRLRQMSGFLIWIAAGSVRLLWTTPRNRRLLLIYDTSSQPFSVGDVLLVQEASLVICERESLDIVDFAIVFEPKHPASSDPAFAAINCDNALFHLASLLPIAQVNQHLGSLFLFNSHAQLERFVADNANRYYVWPTVWKYATREYLYHGIFDDLLYNHFQYYGRVPHLSCRPFLAAWARNFYRTTVCPNVPISVNLRNNTFHKHRNLAIDVWLEFFKHCEGRYPAKFVVICARSEIDDRLRDCANVLLAKDHDTSVEQDLALIHASAIHMGADSGPAVMAVFSDKPYLIVNTVVGPHYFQNPEFVQSDGENLFHFMFASPMQRYATGVESTALLAQEFARMWQGVDAQDWKLAAPALQAEESSVHSWLR